MAELRQGTETRRRQQRDGGSPARRARAVVRRPRRPLEARRRGRRPRLRRRRHRPLLRRARAVPRSRAVPHDAREPPGGVVLHDRRPAEGVRHLGEARIGADEPARRDRRHHPARHEDRVARTGVRRPDRERVRPRRVRIGGADAELLRRAGALRVGLLRHAGADATTSRSTTRTRSTGPSLPYKFKIKASGCPNDCVAAIARADLSIIGTWRDADRRRPGGRAAYAEGGLDVRADVVDRCPSKCMALGRAAPGDRQRRLRAGACTAST